MPRSVERCQEAADERVYYPLQVIPYTSAAWFARGRSDPAFRTKLTIAVDLVKQAVAWHWPFKAAVADSFLRAWVEQSYKQVKTTLGWAQYQVRSSRAIQRHWTLVYCAFTFCWWQAGRQPAADGWLGEPAQQLSTTRNPAAPPREKRFRHGAGPT